jgi:hypothetical protein
MKPDRQGRFSSKGIEMDAKRKNEMRLLKMIEDSEPPVCIDCPDGDVDEAILRRLRAASLISGEWGRGEGVNTLLNAALTGSGRTLLRVLEQEESESTSIGLLKKNRFAIYKWFLNLLAGVVIGWLLKSFFK